MSQPVVMHTAMSSTRLVVGWMAGWLELVEAARATIRCNLGKENTLFGTSSFGRREKCYKRVVMIY